MQKYNALEKFPEYLYSEDEISTSYYDLPPFKLSKIRTYTPK